MTRLLDIKTGNEVRRFHPGSTIQDAAFSPDGNYIGTANWDNTAWLWDIESGRELKRLKGHERFVSAIAFSPDGKRLDRKLG